MSGEADGKSRPSVTEGGRKSEDGTCLWKATVRDWVTNLEGLCRNDNYFGACHTCCDTLLWFFPKTPTAAIRAYLYVRSSAFRINKADKAMASTALSLGHFPNLSRQVSLPKHLGKARCLVSADTQHKYSGKYIRRIQYNRQ